LPRADGKGRIPAVEVLLTTPTIKDYLMDPVKTLLIQSAIEEGYGQYGMQTFDQSIFKLYKDGMIAYDDAIQAVTNPDEFKLRLVGIEATAERGWGAFDKK
jgi:twitching motility protein PilT